MYTESLKSLWIDQSWINSVAIRWEEYERESEIFWSTFSRLRSATQRWLGNRSQPRPDIVPLPLPVLSRVIINRSISPPPPPPRYIHLREDTASYPPPTRPQASPSHHKASTHLEFSVIFLLLKTLKALFSV